MKEKILIFCGVSLVFVAIGALLYYTIDPVKKAKGRASHLTRVYNIITIEGCEYITYSDHNNGFMAHKGNCKNRNEH